MAYDIEKLMWAIVLSILAVFICKHYTIQDRPRVVYVEPVQIPYYETQARRALYGLESDEKIMLCRGSSPCKKLAEAMVYEARSESWEGLLAVGFVVVERANTPGRWPDSIEGVVNQVTRNTCQFSYRCKKQKKAPHEEDWGRAYVGAYDILNKEVDNPIPASDHYHTLQVKPRWAKHMTYVATLGNHKFYKE